MDKAYVANVGTTLNPHDPLKSKFYGDFTSDGTKPSGYIYESIKTPGSLRIVLSAGAFATVAVGDEHTFYADQSGRRGGRYRVVGIKHFGNGRTFGNVPDRALPLSVYK